MAVVPEAEGRQPADQRDFTGLSRLAFVGSVLLSVACGADDPRQAGTKSTTAATRTAAAGMVPPLPSRASTAPPSTSGPAAVAIANFAFLPDPVVVRPGGTVTWTNQDEAPHSIRDTSSAATPESKPLNKEENFSITYAKAGTYPYICGIHNYMQGSVEVKS